ncbi:hypothetical protein D3C75_1173350 [compost metagenome]
MGSSLDGVQAMYVENFIDSNWGSGCGLGQCARYYAQKSWIRLAFGLKLAEPRQLLDFPFVQLALRIDHHARSSLQPLRTTI